ncbi:hypothetical protein GCM10009678_92150 [Actinomadura kijaniata]|uniref:Uncharacterized protein n=1 Tax=Actinomadura namibiensis TaxID=182080 RepID=A0A7W3QS43_ACTNM|nr:hypothetical protein [Actinomadura namibiensis]MBA8957434.1 hypothetical protein [Actinomadura namibiensis]
MVSIREFRRTCYAVTRRTGGQAVEFRLAEGAIPNFHQGLIAYRDHTVAVVCSRDLAVLAVAEPRIIDFADGAAESGPLTFVDVPALTAALAEEPGFRVFIPSELNGPFDATSWPHVLPSDITYWKPATLGEALFNYWD